MEPVPTNGRFKALTLIEVIVVIAVMVVLIVVVLPWLAKPHTQGQRLHCVNNLKQVGLAARIFAEDNGNKSPWQISTNVGGSREYVDVPNSAFRHFQVMSNELSTPIILLCPEDKQRTRATNWLIGNQNISYFVGLNASETNTNSILSGDRYLSGSRQPADGFLELSSKDSVTWAKNYHKYKGNLAFGDGSVRQLDSAELRQALLESGVATNRLAIP